MVIPHAKPYKRKDFGRRASIALELLKTDLSYVEIAKKVGVSKQRIGQLANIERHRARQRLTYAVRTGQIKPAKKYKCVDCSRKAKEFDHSLGYSGDNKYFVEPVCKKCHTARYVNRKEAAHGQNHYMAKLTPIKVMAMRRIKKKLGSKISWRELGLKYGVSHSTARDAVTPGKWAHWADLPYI